MLIKPDGQPAWKEEIPFPGVGFAGAISDDGSLLALSLNNDTIEIRRIADSGTQVISVINGIHDDINAMEFDLPRPDRLHVITSGWFHRVYAVWPDADIEQISSAHHSTVRRLAFDASGRLLASGGYDGYIKVWDAVTHQKLAEFVAMRKDAIQWNAPVDGITDLHFLPDGRLLSADVHGQARLWDWKNGLAVATCNNGVHQQGGVAISDDGRTLYSAGGNKITQFDLQSGQSEGETFGQDIVNGRELNYRVIWPKDKTRLIVLRSPYHGAAPQMQLIRCQIWDLSGPEPTLLRELRHHTDGLRDADLSPDQSLLAISSRDGTATLWDWNKGTLLHVLSASPGHSDVNFISAIKFHPTAPIVATAGHDNRLLFWSSQTGRQLAELNVDEQHRRGFGYTGLLKDIAFSPDGKTLAITVGNDIWWLDLTYFNHQIDELSARRTAPNFTPSPPAAN